MARRKVDEIKERVRSIHHLIGDLLELDGVFSSRRSVVFRGLPRVPLPDFQMAAGGRLRAAGYDYDIETARPPGTLAERVLLSIRFEEATTRFPWVNVLLFVITIASVILQVGAQFAGWFLAILLFHEFGHFIAARQGNIDSSWPYFIPAPIIFIFGTLGAVISLRSPIRDRRALFDMAVAGPLAGAVVAIIALFVGLGQSTVVATPDSGTGLILGESLLFKWIAALVMPGVTGDQHILLHPIAFAGWAGLLVTMLNLLPMGQLDGGHIAYALFGRFQRQIAIAVMVGLAIASIWWPGWLIWVAIGFLMKPQHPPTLIDEIPLTKRRRILGWIALALFVLTFTPQPLSLP
jgi:membrane-associated protease RseP (regulator of RpoE activity)